MSNKSTEVRNMFSEIARRYDFLNHFLSGNIDRRWRRSCVQEVSRRLAPGKALILDVGCGTGDLSLAFSGIGPVIGCDFCRPMLRIFQEKLARTAHQNPVSILEGDALSLPFPDERFDAVVSAFVLRNLTDAKSGLREMRRVIRHNGVLAVLDFSMPKTPVIASIYRFYFHHVLPKLGSLISGVQGPYRYLPDSVQTFPGPEALKALLAGAGFTNVEHRLFAGGIAVLLLARAHNSGWEAIRSKKVSKTRQIF